MRGFNDFDESFRFLIRAVKDKDYMEEFNLEVGRAINHFFNWYKNGDSLYTAEIKMISSYGMIVSDMAMYYIVKNISK